MNTCGANFTLTSDNVIAPSRAHDNDAGLDIAIQQDIILSPGECKYCGAGVALQLPKNVCAWVVTRSSTFKKGLSVVPTIVDSNYTGEISTIVHNTSNAPVTISRGTRLAQVVLTRCYAFDNEEQPTNTRPVGAKFGSSGE